MDRRILCDSLIKWIKTLNLNRAIHSIGDFCDGELIAICLQNIDENHFDENWLAKIRTDIGENSRIKENNLKKILKTLVDYYSEILDQPLTDFQMPDLNLIAENFDETELSRLLQLVLGCAVSCNRKQVYIEHIMSLEASVQHVLMNAIQELMTKENRKHTDDYSEITIQLKNALEELNRVAESKEEIENRCRELDLQIVTLEDEKMNLVEETNELNRRLQQYENTQQTDSISQNRFQILQQRIDLQQEEIFRLETAVQDYRSKFEILREENDNLLKQNDNLMVLADNARSFKDELDILRNKCEKMTKLESTIETYKTKLEDMSNLRQQMKYLEETNLRLFDEKSQLEQECKQIKLLQTQIEFHKKTNQDLYQKYHELQRSTEKIEFEKNRLEEKFHTINAEKINLNEEIQLLRETNQQSKIDEIIDEEDNSQVQSPDSFEGFNFINVPIEIRERIVRLQHENQMLKSHENDETNNEQISLLQAQCEQLKDQNHQLTNDLWMANQKILELEATLKETNSSNEVADLKISLNRTTTRHEDETMKMKYQIDELEKRLENTQKQLNKKNKLLLKKTTEIDPMEERYVQYLEKAKMILRQMDPRNNSLANNQEIQSLRKQIEDRDRKLKDTQKEYEKMKAIKEDQEKLLVSAWYSLGSSFQRQEYEERLKAHQNQSFLSKQRHIPSSSSHKQPPHDPSKK